MEQAARSFQEAADLAARLSEGGKESGDPSLTKEAGDKGAAARGLVDPTVFGKEYRKYAGRPWGELPGELRTRIVQNMRARYGDDYARIIQRYFQQIAETKKR